MTFTRITQLDPLPADTPGPPPGSITTIPNRERVCTPWAWEQIRQGKGGNVRGKYVLLGCAEHADRALWSGDGYTCSTIDDIVHVTTLEARKVEAAVYWLVDHGLLVAHGPGYRVPEEVFNR